MYSKDLWALSVNIEGRGARDKEQHSIFVLRSNYKSVKSASTHASPKRRLLFHISHNPFNCYTSFSFRLGSSLNFCFCDRWVQRRNITQDWSLMAKGFGKKSLYYHV